jgi:hypothetical protein
MVKNINLDGFETIGDGIFIYKNFLSAEVAENIYNLALLRENWRNSSKYGGGPSISGEDKDLQFLYHQMSTCFNEDAVLDNYWYFQKYKIGQLMSAHQDNNKVLDDMEKAKTYVEGMEYKEVRQPLFGIVLYLNTPEEGGELVYTEQNITYKPMPGDLLVHEADKKCTHMSAEVTKGIKIVVPSYAYQIIKVPIDKVVD